MRLLWGCLMIQGPRAPFSNIAFTFIEVMFGFHLLELSFILKQV